MKFAPEPRPLRIGGRGMRPRPNGLRFSALTPKALNNPPQAQIDALEAFYTATNGDNWTDNTGWMEAPRIKDWYEVTVNPIPDVVGLTPALNNLSGEIGNSLAGLTTLLTFRVNGNTGLTGALTFPSSVISNVNIANTGITMVDWSEIPNVINLYSQDTGLTNFDLSSNTKASIIRIDDNDLTEAAVDAALLSVYTSRMNYTDPTPFLNIGGSNAVPSATGIGYIEKLVYDPDGDGHVKWTIEYTKPAYTGATEAEVDALIEFFYASGGPNWTNRTGWVTSTDVSTWYGVTLETGHVAELNLTGNNLTGAAGGSLEGLDWLDKLFVYGNYLDSLDVTTLTAMLNLHIGNNDGITFTGLSALTNLLQFWCYETGFDDVDLSSNTKLIGFYGYGNELTAVDFSAATKIRSITLQDNGAGGNGMSAAEIDAQIDNIWQARNDFTYATPACNIGGTNAAPSGTYQAASPPTTGKEKIYDLENNFGWSFDYS